MIVKRRDASGTWWRNGRATAALEFAVVAPVFMLFLFAALGVGLGGYYQLTLDDAVRDAARQVQIGGPASTSGANFVAAVCQEFGWLASDCVTNLSYNVQANASPATFASLTPVTLSAGGTLPGSFPGSLTNNANCLIQVSYPLPFVLPYIGQAVTFTGTNAILSVVTIRMEPYL